MVRSLQDAFDRINRLPADEQEDLAAFIMAELDAEQRWTHLISKSTDTLKKLADEALSEHKQDKTRPFESERDLEND